MATTIYGASDDLIEVDGDVRGEFCDPTDRAHRVACSDGTTFAIQYAGEGEWRVSDLHEGASFLALALSDGAESDNYTDRVTLDEGLTWVTIDGKGVS